MATPLLVTRPEPDASALVATLRARGVDARALPCLRVAPVPLGPATLDPWRGHPATLALTSPRAVPVAVTLGVDPAWRVLALAPRTAALAGAAGLVVTPVHGGAADLARAAGPEPLLLIASDLAGAEMRPLRPDLVHLVAWRTVAVDALVLPPGPVDVLFASPSAVEAFVHLAPRAPVRHAWCHGRTTLEAARRAGLPAHLRPLDEPPDATPPSTPPL